MYMNFPIFLGFLPVFGPEVLIFGFLPLCYTFSFPPDPGKLVFDPTMTILRFKVIGWQKKWVMSILKFK